MFWKSTNLSLKKVKIKLFFGERKLFFFGLDGGEGVGGLLFVCAIFLDKVEYILGVLYKKLIFASFKLRKNDNILRCLRIQIVYLNSATIASL